MAKVWLPLAWVLLLGACDPQVTDDTYFCGPNRSCPPGQRCNEPIFSCGDPARAQSFECPGTTNAAEPNEDASEAIELGTVECGSGFVEPTPGCIADGGDRDVYQFVHAELCELRNRAEVSLSFPAAFVPLTLDITDDDGNSVGSPVDCSNDDIARSGTYRVCLDFELDVGTYTVDIGAADRDDCGGDCRYNQYTLDIRLPL